MREKRSETGGLPAVARRVALTAAWVLAAACGDGGEPAPEREVQRGRVVYDRVCATCHGRDAMGIRMLGSALRDNEWVREQSDRELVKLLEEGRPATDPLNTTGVDMPPKGGDPSLSDEDLANVVAYLRSL